MPASPRSRRNFLRQSSIAGVGLLLPASANLRTPPAVDKKKDAEDISPAEDLMREHGVLNRVLLIYDHHLHMLTAKQTFDGSVLVSAADVIRQFVEDYHEKLEEDFLFPRFRKAGKMVSLVDTLLAQHKAGRVLTVQIRELASVATLKYVSDTDKLGDALRSFLRMYALTRLAKIQFCFQPSAPSSRRMSTTPSAKTSRRKKTNSSATKASSKWSTRSRSWRRS